MKRAKEARKQSKQQLPLQPRDEQHVAHAAPASPAPSVPPERKFSKRITADAPTNSTAAAASPAVNWSRFSMLTPFACSLCTFHNRGGEACEMCCEPRASSSELEVANSEFKCAVCGKRNKSGAYCSACFAVRPDMIETEADDDYDDEQPRRSKRRRTATKQLSAPLKSNNKKRPTEERQQSDKRGQRESEEAAEKAEASGALVGIDATADARIIFLQTDWQALSNEIEWIRRKMQEERQNMAREKKIREEQLAALQNRYTWPVHTTPSAPPLNAEDKEQQSGKQEAIDIDLTSVMGQ